MTKADPQWTIWLSSTQQGTQPVENDDVMEWLQHFQKFLYIILEQLLPTPPVVEFIQQDFQPQNPYWMLVSVLAVDYKPSTYNPSPLTQIDQYFKYNQVTDLEHYLFKVIQSPVQEDIQPDLIRSLMGYQFYKTLEDGSIEVFESPESFFSAEAEQHYWIPMTDLAYDIFNAIQRRQALGEGFHDKKAPKAVYLAETTPDLFLYRYIIQRELKKYGFEVFPNRTLPLEASELKQTMHKYLKKSSISIHLIGSSYGTVLEGSESSLVELQNKIAAEYYDEVFRDLPKNKEAPFKRLIWVPTFLKNLNEKQILFLEALKADANLSKGAEIVQIPLEDLKVIIKEQVFEQNKGVFEVIQPEAGKPVLYLIFDKSDKEGAAPLQEFFKHRGIEVIAPVFEGKLLEIHYSHIRNLKICDSAMIYYGKVDEKWVNTKISDLLKSPGMGRIHKLLAKGIYLEQGKTYKNDMLGYFDIECIDQPPVLSDAQQVHSLSVFAQKIIDGKPYAQAIRTTTEDEEDED